MNARCMSIRDGLWSMAMAMAMASLALKDISPSLPHLCMGLGSLFGLGLIGLGWGHY